nr:uncharacterized protein LOC129164432 [Nothobranchius furzeri]
MSSSFKIALGTRIESLTNTYIVKLLPPVEINGEVLTICQDQNEEMYYVKCIHKRVLHRYKQEANLLLYLNDLFPNEKKFVKIIETFDYGDWFCFALEKLNTTLLNFVENQENKRLNIKDIRTIAQQIISALNTLKKAGITHNNITAKTIELLEDGLHIKLNGFSYAGRTSELSKMEVPINCGFSAPEILINSPLDERADVWSVGCLLAQLCFGASLFPTFCEYEYLKMIVKVLGPPKKAVLDQGLCTQQFFKQGPVWSLKAPEQNTKNKTRRFDKSNPSFDNLDSLDQLLEKLPENAESTDNEDMKSFVDLLQKMLRFDPKERISAIDALMHEFFPRMQDDSSEAEGFTLDVDAVIKHKSDVYRCDNVLSCGSFGKVGKFIQLATKQVFAIKVFTEENHFEQEVETLRFLSETGLLKLNIVTYKDSFPYKDCYFIRLELLDLNLNEFMKRRNYKPLRVSEIRPFAEQLFGALKALRFHDITHLHIKPGHIMLVNHDFQPFQLKLIDFREAQSREQLSKFVVAQNGQYSAPEMFLGVPLDKSVDMWGVACVLALLSLGRDLFPHGSEYEVLRDMIKLLGMPDESSLTTGERVKNFFKWSMKTSGIFWILKTPAEFILDGGETDENSLPHFDDFTSLQIVLTVGSVKRKQSELEVFASFVDLLKKILVMNKVDRILPADALCHPFITKKRLPVCSSSHVNEKELDDTTNKAVEEFFLDRGAVIKYGSDVYQCDKILECRSFGVVSKFKKLGTKLKVAVKIITEESYFEKELEALQLLRDLDQKVPNIIKYIVGFPYNGSFFVISELLDLNLLNFMKRRDYSPLRVSEIRPIAHQLFAALRALKSFGVTHLDIKPSNIMLVNHNSQPYGVKLIDFATACRTEALSTFDIVQSKQYRAPEVFLGLPYDEGLDMWGVGCVLAFLSLGRDLFPPDSQYEVVRVMIKLFGLPDETLLAVSWRVYTFFNKRPNRLLDSWKLKTPAEYELHSEETVKECWPHFDASTSLKYLITRASNQSHTPEMEDLTSFIDLLERVLAINSKDRILPEDALHHPFITKERLPVCSSSHVTEKELDDTKNKAVAEFVVDGGAVIKYGSDVYQCDEIIESRSFGDVSKFKKLGTKLKVAVKRITEESYFEKELKALQLLRDLDQNVPNIIKYIAGFPYDGSFFVISELLDLNLLNFMKRRDYGPLRVSEIRPIAQQLFAALGALKSFGVTHLDIKPSNIMLVNHDSQPYCVKLIDFATACRTEALSTFDIVQSKQYRAPEVFIGAPYSEGLDMWGVGCVLAFLSLGRDLFPPDSQYEVVRVMIKLFGLPDETSLDNGWRAHCFFTCSYTESGNSWRFKTPAEYEQDSEETVKKSWPHFNASTSLENLITIESNESHTPEMEDLTLFIDLLKRVLAMNSIRRIFPEDALKHPFIMMERLPRDSSSHCVTEAYQIAGSQNTKPASSEASSDDSESSEEMETSILTVDKGVKLIDKSIVYEVEEIIGSGSNRLVAKCRKVGTDKIVVIKVFRKKNHLAAINEVCDINRLSILGANKNSVPTFIDNFIYKDCICLVFELLHLNLCDFLQRQRWKPMSVADIKLIALQMLIFLRTLKRIGLTHADIKPSNIMLVNQESQPFKVKLIGFGLALETATLSEFAKVQAVGYRAPEVYMGLPYNESIDMWSLGCTLVFMYLAKHLFPEDEYNVMRLIVKCCGMPNEDALEKGERSRDFFKRTECGNNSHWMLKTEEEYEEDEEITIPTLHPFYERLQSLDDLEIMAPDTRTLNEKKEIKAFVQLVKRMLKLNPADRILPDDALKHPFFSMGAYPQSFKSCVSEAHEKQPAVNLTNPGKFNKVKNTRGHSVLTDSKKEMKTSTLNLKKGVKLIDESNVYIIEEVTGSESFGEVVRCRQIGKPHRVEIKLFRKENHLKGIKGMNDCKLNPRNKNRIKFTDCFIYKDFFCLVCEPET